MIITEINGDSKKWGEWQELQSYRFVLVFFFMKAGSCAQLWHEEIWKTRILESHILTLRYVCYETFGRSDLEMSSLY